jgi:hypothetical protein
MGLCCNMPEGGTLKVNVKIIRMNNFLYTLANLLFKACFVRGFDQFFLDQFHGDCIGKRFYTVVESADGFSPPMFF